LLSPSGAIVPDGRGCGKLAITKAEQGYRCLGSHTRRIPAAAIGYFLKANWFRLASPWSFAYKYFHHGASSALSDFTDQLARIKF
jgi:hypothetical protein